MAQNEVRPRVQQMPELRPSLVLLQRDVISKAASRWKDLGLELLGDEYIRKLDNIEIDHPHSTEERCKRMFQKWLEISTSATWDQVVKALNNIQLHHLAAQISKNVLTGSANYSSSQSNHPDDDDDNSGQFNFDAHVISRLIGEYAKTVNKIKKIFEQNKNLTVRELILHLCNCDPLNRTVFSTDDAFDKLTDTARVFHQIGISCNMYDYDLLLALVESTECIEAKNLLDGFTKQLSDSILKELDLMSVDGELKSQKILPGTHALKIKYKGRCTLESQQMIKEIICKCFHLPKVSFQFTSVQEGCVTFVYQISSAVRSYLLQYEITKDIVFQLADNKIRDMSIDDEGLLTQGKTQKVLQVLSCQCCSPKQLALNSLGVSLAVSGVFRFWIPLEPLLILLHVNPLVSIAQLLLLFNWTVCFLLESYSVAVEFIFQVPWSHLKLENISKLRLAAIVVMTSMGLACMCSMWEMCVDVRNCVSESGYSWMNIPLLLAMFSAMAHSVVLGLCVPIQAIIVPLYCNERIPNTGFRQRDITLLTTHAWLFIHFIYLCVYYSSYHSPVHVLAILYRSFCTGWMIIYCYPDLTLSTYHWLKRLIPDRVRPIVRFIVRDNYLSNKIWRNVKRVIYQRMGEDFYDVDRSNLVKSIYSVWMEIITPVNKNIMLELQTPTQCTDNCSQPMDEQLTDERFSKDVVDRGNLVTSICSVWMEIIRRVVCDVVKLIVATYHIASFYLAILVFIFMIAIDIDIDHIQFYEKLKLETPTQCTDNCMVTDERFSWSNLVTSTCSRWIKFIRHVACDVVVANSKVLVLSILTYHIANFYLASIVFIVMIAIKIYLTDVNQRLEQQTPTQCTDDSMDEPDSIQYTKYMNYSQLMDKQLTDKAFDENFEVQNPTQCTDSDLIK